MFAEVVIAVFANTLPTKVSESPRVIFRPDKIFPTQVELAAPSVKFPVITQ